MEPVGILTVEEVMGGPSVQGAGPEGPGTCRSCLWGVERWGKGAEGEVWGRGRTLTPRNLGRSFQKEEVVDQLCHCHECPPRLGTLSPLTPPSRDILEGLVAEAEDCGPQEKGGDVDTDSLGFLTDPRRRPPWWPPVPAVAVWPAWTLQRGQVAGPRPLTLSSGRVGLAHARSVSHWRAPGRKGFILALHMRRGRPRGGGAAPSQVKTV